MQIIQRVTTLIQYVVGLVEILIILRVILRLFGASTRAPFAGWVYQTSQPLLKPFEGLFPSPIVDGTFVVDFSALFAATMYALLGLAAIELVKYIGSGFSRS